jgi:hypothetical protein
MRDDFRLSGLAAFAVALSAALAAPAAFGQGRLVQSLEAFHTPAGAVFSAEGDTLFVTNAARGEYGMVAGRGAVSKVRLQPDGQLKMEVARFIDKLTAPLGITELPAPVAGLPEGTLVVTVGGSWVVDAAGHSLDARTAGTGLAFFNPATGSELGRVYLGLGSPVQALIGHPLIDPGAVAADLRGSLYVSDLAGGGTAAPRGDAAPGVIKISPDALAVLLRGEAPPRGSVQFAPVKDIPTGLAYATSEDALYWGTGSVTGELGGGIMRLPKGDFSGVARLETVVKLTNSLASIAVAPGGTVLAARNEGDVIFVRGRGKFRPVRFKEERSFLSPGQIAATRLPDGSVCVVVPELSGAGLGAWRQRLQVFTLPKDF